MPWGDHTGPCWKNATGNNASEPCHCGRRMHTRRGHADRAEDMADTCDVPQHPTPAEEKSYLEDKAKRLEEELLQVKDRIEKLR